MAPAPGLSLGSARVIAAVPRACLDISGEPCHEGNYALPGILAGAREEERAAAAKNGSVTQKSDKEVEAELKGE